MSERPEDVLADPAVRAEWEAFVASRAKPAGIQVEAASRDVCRYSYRVMEGDPRVEVYDSQTGDKRFGTVLRADNRGAIITVYSTILYAVRYEGWPESNLTEAEIEEWSREQQS